MRKLSFEEMVKRSREVHGDKYVYHAIAEEVKLVSLVVECEKHGRYVQNYSNHIRGRGCKKCAAVNLSERKLASLEEIAAKASGVHAGKGYTYTSVTLPVANSRTLTIVCPQHGEFEQLVANHLQGTSCPLCSRANGTMAQRLSLDNCLGRVSSVHGDTYEVKGFHFKDGANLVTAVCKTHGEFTIKAGQFTGGRGCPECAAEVRRWVLKDFIDVASVKHGNKYIYIGLYGPKEYRKVLAICPTHGSFTCGINGHLNNRGVNCAKCADELQSERMRLTHEQVLDRAVAVHGNTYKLLTTELLEGKSKTTAVCELHGMFTINSSDMLRGQGCPDCSKGGKSKLGTEMIEYVRALAPDAQEEARIGATRYKWDVLVPSRSLAFEFHGLYWHSEEYRSSSYHKDKHNLGLAQGVRTIHIYEDEWVARQVAVKSLITRLLLPVTSKVSARATALKKLGYNEAAKFLEANHIQGATQGSLYLGLEYCGEVVAVLGYATRESGRGKVNSLTEAEITRYATSTQVVGGFSRLLAGLKALQPTLISVYTFSDVRVFTGAMYAVTGFTNVATLAPDYFYVRSGKRQRKATLQKSSIKKNPKLLYADNLTERELATLNGFYRLYDCGKLKWAKQLA